MKGRKRAKINAAAHRVSCRAMNWTALPLLLCASAAIAADAPPTLDQLVSLQRPYDPALSPDGTKVVYTVRGTDWDKNAFTQRLAIADVKAATSRPIAEGLESSYAAQWSPDGKRLAFLSEREGKTQIFTAAADGSDPKALTNVTTGVALYAWSPDGKTIAFVARIPKPDALTKRDKEESGYEVVGEYAPQSQLFLANTTTKEVSQLTSGQNSIRRFTWSHDGKRIAFDHRPSDNTNTEFNSDLSVVDVESKAVKSLVSRPGPDQWPVWSPDDTQILFVTGNGNAGHHYFSNGQLATVPAQGGEVTLLKVQHDELMIPIDWEPPGIYMRSFAGPFPNLYRVDPTTGKVTLMAPGKEWITSGRSWNKERNELAFICATPQTYDEVCVRQYGNPDDGAPHHAVRRPAKNLAKNHA